MAAGDRAYQQGRYAEAERFFTSALERAERVGPQDPRVALSLGLLAAAYQAGGSYAPAEPLLQRALVIGETLLGPNHPEVASTLTALARLDTAQGRFAQADPFLRRALAIDERVLGPEHLEVAGTLDALASLERQQGRYTDAETRSRRALAIREKTLGPEHPDVAASLWTLAALYQTQSRYVETEQLAQRALVIREKALGPEHPAVIPPLVTLSELYLEQGDIGLVFESVNERRVLMKMAPHLVAPLGFLFPVFVGAKRGLPLVSTGMWMYDALSLFRSPKLHKIVSAAELPVEEPCLRTEGIAGAPLYYDCATDDARLTVEVALSAVELGAKLIIRRVEEAIAAGIAVPSPGEVSRNRLQIPTLLAAIEEFRFDCCIGGARRDEEKARAKERFFSFRDTFGQWDPKNQRPELWNLYNTRLQGGEHMRVFPLSNWTEMDVWEYIRQEKLDVPSIKDEATYQDAALLERAWHLPVAATFQRGLFFQPNGSVCGPTSVANVQRSFGRGSASVDSVLDGTGKCWTGLPSCVLRAGEPHSRRS